MSGKGGYSYASASGPGAATFTSQTVGDKTVASSLSGGPGPGPVQERIWETEKTTTTSQPILDTARSLATGERDIRNIEGVRVDDRVTAGGVGSGIPVTEGQRGFERAAQLSQGASDSLAGTTAGGSTTGAVGSRTGGGAVGSGLGSGSSVEKRVSDLERPGPGETDAHNCCAGKTMHRRNQPGHNRNECCWAPRLHLQARPGSAGTGEQLHGSGGQAGQGTA